jgi:hypothetical protein
MDVVLIDLLCTCLCFPCTLVLCVGKTDRKSAELPTQDSLSPHIMRARLKPGNSPPDIWSWPRELRWCKGASKWTKRSRHRGRHSSFLRLIIEETRPNCFSYSVSTPFLIHTIGWKGLFLMTVGIRAQSRKELPMKPHLLQGHSSVSQSPVYLRLFCRKEPASQWSPVTLKPKRDRTKRRSSGHREVTSC